MTHEAAEVEERGEGNAEAGMENSGFVKEDSPRNGSKSGKWGRRLANCKLAHSHSHLFNDPVTLTVTYHISYRYRWKEYVNFD